jgi:mRNA interferase MazF
MVKGDLVLITFPFTDLNGSKLRPAVVLAYTSLDITVCFVTTQIQWREETDVLILPSRRNGLKQNSLVRTSKIATLDKSLAKGLLGELSEGDLSELDTKLKMIFKLP